MNESDVNQKLFTKIDWPLLSFMAAAVAVGLLILWAVVGAVYGVRSLSSNEAIRKEVSDGTWELKKLEAEEKKKLTEYKMIDKDSLIVQIPIQRAMELLVEEASDNQEVANDEEAAEDSLQ
jgi:hypothetical protein